ncbi:NACHT domain-containing protein [Amycolatopsis sp. FBCC-B4732]|uniref:NACHT domain-containing protein n=1 Tax=Amycolatopsis sp. FBCC-B4732 TaxID=3079339 RepID=UPI001FF63157|nr:NACHT domain-containing protein [Amycolatopsis sp. FBCC-B4732]UOX92474.1 NACHT domain-containing protein [Amycolatopsis sp. FBCC-B4732]
MVDPVTAKLAGVAAETILKRIRRMAARRGYVKDSAVAVTERKLENQYEGYWPASLMRLLPPGRTQRDIDRFVRTPELQAFTRLLIAAHMLDGRPELRKRLFGSIQDALLDFLPPVFVADREVPSEPEQRIARYQAALRKYGAEFCEHLSASCDAAAEDIKQRSEDPAVAHAWAYNLVATDILQAVEGSLAHLARDVRERTSLDWVPRYREQFVAYHREINSPDVNDRKTIDYEDLFVGPTVLQSDPKTLRPFDDIGAQRPETTFRRFWETLDQAVLLGDPGAGKSTSSTVAAIELCRHAGVVPFVVVLREVPDPGFYLPELLVRVLRKYEVAVTPDSLEKLLREGSSLVVFDGLDEIADASRRADLAKKIETVACAYPFLKILVTCRKVGYRTAALSDRRFSVFQVGPFSRGQTREYVTKWFTTQAGLSGRYVEYSVHDFLAASKEMQDLTQNPLLLAFMCVLYRGLRTLPTDRPSLYDKCVQLLLGDRDKGIIDNVPSIEDTKTALSRIASVELEGGDQVGLTRSQIVEDLVPFLVSTVFATERGAERFVRDMLAWCRGRAWMFTDFGPGDDHRDLFTFTHASFREYFGALYFVRTHPDVESVVAHLYPLVRDGKSEIYAQVCCALFEQGRLSGASSVISAIVERLKADYPVLLDRDLRAIGTGQDRAHVDRVRSVGSAYLAGMADGLPLSPEATRSLVRLALEQTALGDSASVARLLDPAYRHHESILELMVEDLIASVGALRGEAFARRQVWFAIHARYLLAGAAQGVPIRRKAVESLNGVVKAIGPYLKRYDGVLDIEYAMFVQSGNTESENFVKLDGSQFCQVFAFLFEQYTVPIPGVGPSSTIRWVFDSFRSEHREAMPVARVAAFLRSFGAAVDAHLDRLYELSPPQHAAIADFGFEAVLARIAAYPVECRSSLLFLIAAQMELNERLDPVSTYSEDRGVVEGWARQVGVGERVAVLLEQWARGVIDLWSPFDQGTS